MRAVNLLPDNRRPGRRSAEETQARLARATVAGSGALVVLISSLMALTAVQARSSVSDKKSTLADLHRELEGTRASSSLAIAAKQQLQARLTAVSTAASGRIAWDGLLFDLGRVMPRDAWLSSLTAQSPQAAAASGAPVPAAATNEVVPTAFLITGFARSESVVPLVLERLALVPALSDVGLESTQRVDVGKRKAVQFTIGANVATGAS